MKYIFLGVGDYGVTNKPDTALKTMALGSCVSVVLICPLAKTVGMVHIALPDSNINKDLSYSKPGYFADTGIIKLLDEMKKYNCIYRNNLIVKIIGGASILDKQKIFNVGKRNTEAVKSILTELGMQICSEDIGKELSRTVTVIAETGKVIVSSPEFGEWEV